MKPSPTTTIAIRKESLAKFKWVRNAASAASDPDMMDAILNYMEANPRIINEIRMINLANQPR